MKNKKKMLIIVGVALLIVLTIAFTYAYWQITKTQTNSNVVSSACLDISLSNEQNDITLTEQYPISDTEGAALTPYTFTVTNNCAAELEYQIALESLGDSTNSISPGAIKVKFNDDKATLLDSFVSVTPTITEAYASHKIKTASLAAKGTEGDSITHSLRLWIDENASISEINKTFTSKITVTVGEGLDTYENVIKEYSGNYVLADYVAINKHNLEVSVESASLSKEELQNVGIRRVGQNLANVDAVAATESTASPLVVNDNGSYTFTKTATSRLTPFTDIFIPANTKFQISAYLGSTENVKDLKISDLKIQLNSNSQKCTTDATTGEETCTNYSIHTYFLDTQLGEDGYLLSAGLTADYDINQIRFYVSSDITNNASITFSEFQIAIYPEYDRLSYAKYDEQKVLVSNVVENDSKITGTANGLTSISPSMILSPYVNPDYEGTIDLSDVLINLTYKQGYKYNLTGKNIVNFGDSIFAIGTTTSSVTSYLTTYTGANITRTAFGGSRMSWHSEGSIEFSMHSLADAITTNDYTLQEEALTLRAEDDGYDEYGETLDVLKNINFEEVDIITIALGTNDFSGNRPLENTDNLYDKTSYAGALRYSIETIQAKYPNIEIVLCTPIYRFFQDESENWIGSDSYSVTFTDTVSGKEYTQKLPDFVEKIKEIANEYNLNVIDNYYQSGINDTNRETIFTIENDGVHPNPIGREMVAKNMAKELYKYFN